MPQKSLKFKEFLGIFEVEEILKNRRFVEAYKNEVFVAEETEFPPVRKIRCIFLKFYEFPNHKNLLVFEGLFTI
jgi:hypothetical protein